MTVTAAPLERVELERTISATGSVFAWQDVIIASEVGGYRVAEVFVDVGDRVTRGQRLVARRSERAHPRLDVVTGAERAHQLGDVDPGAAVHLRRVLPAQDVDTHTSTLSRTMATLGA